MHRGAHLRALSLTLLTTGSTTSIESLPIDLHFGVASALSGGRLGSCESRGSVLPTFLTSLHFSLLTF